MMYKFRKSKECEMPLTLDAHTEYINIQALKDENDRLKKVIQRYEVMIEQYSKLTDEYKELIK